jgi:predicted dehydrogenase
MKRRDFMQMSGAAAAFTIIPRHVLGGAGFRAPSDLLNIAAIGSGGMGAQNLERCSHENIVALCDVDDQRAAKTYSRFPKAKTYRDFRIMLERQNDIDAVIVATPDHTHAVAAMAAMQLGKHVYVQKPLAHSIYETRMLTEAARKYGVETQMGNQGHSSEHIRLLCEWIWDGAIGEIREIHAWSDRPSGAHPFPVALKRPAETPPVPEHMDWNLWLGPAAYRPYHPAYAPGKWRGWLDFGTGALGDMGCHILDPAFWALKLGHPTYVEANTTHDDPEISTETYPVASIVRYQFPERNGLPPLQLTWFDGGMLPPQPWELEPGRKIPSNGCIFIGEEGKIIHGTSGAEGMRIIPEERMNEYKRPPKTLPRVEGTHEQDWIDACKGFGPASSTFDYGGPLTEMVLLGLVAMRVKDQRLAWDGEAMRVTNNDEANRFVTPEFREGWSLT